MNKKKNFFKVFLQQVYNENERKKMVKIEHVAMYVEDLEKAKEFFCRYFSAKSNDMYHNKTTGFKSYFLSFSDGSRLEVMTHPEIQMEEKKLKRTGFIHLAFSLGSREKVDLLTERLKADGYEVLSGPRTTGDGYYESCILGIEGNQIELTE